MSHITRKLVLLLGVSQLVCWGISYYLIGLFGKVMAADLGLSLAVAFGGFTAALLVMGLTSTAIGKAIDRWGGRPVMVAGSLLSAAGCLGLAASTEVVGYYASWLVLGLAMRATLYDAAFAALARLGGPQARKPISQITLLGGLASTTLWPVGQALADAFGWRGALVGYAVLALLTIPLHAAIPAERYERRVEPGSAPADAAAERPHPVPGAPLLFALIVAATGLLASGLSAHMIGILGGLGVAPVAAVWISTLRGIGQSSARLCEVLFGARLHPTSLALIAAALPVPGFLAGMASGQWVAAGIAFALLFGAGNGLATIVRGTLPLVLFDPRTYGSTVGRLVAPSFYVSALAPLAYAVVIERAGEGAALLLSAALELVAVGATAVLWLSFRRAGRRLGGASA
ncbi:MFS transporter [Azospirillum rugosum]|uniref:MFS family permease n=1 Tax=Azospirillum rugosum TaxID=416170 RepID=A0ABS4SIP0_9PROT|nr:MFS transporter [Azospirillum rugosum]MBP2292434.1 MFS family permease [Azospirillum rugosum]MDQ0526193.1 MFS family permease [Azospirillum rugosum]